MEGDPNDIRMSEWYQTLAHNLITKARDVYYDLLKTGARIHPPTFPSASPLVSSDVHHTDHPQHLQETVQSNLVSCHWPPKTCFPSSSSSSTFAAGSVPRKSNMHPPFLPTDPSFLSSSFLFSRGSAELHLQN